MEDGSEDFAAEIFKKAQNRRQYDQTHNRFMEFLEERGEVLGPVERIVAAALTTLYEMGGVANDDSADTLMHKEADRILWMDDLFREPWTTLVATEFRGEGLTREEMDALPSQLGEEMEERLKRQALFNAEIQECVNFLTNRALELSDDDLELVTILAGFKMLNEMRGHSAREEALVALHNSGRTEQAWFELIEHRF